MWSSAPAWSRRNRLGLLLLPFGALAGGFVGCGPDQRPPGVAPTPPPAATPPPAPAPSPPACGLAAIAQMAHRPPTPLASALDPEDGLWAGDLDGDGDPDLVGATFLTSVVHTHVVGLRNGGAAGMVAEELATGRLLVPPIDLDGDGDLDLVARDSDYPPRALRSLLNDGRGRFQPAGESQEVTLGPFGAGDLDGDGLPEIVAAEVDPVVPSTGRSLFVYRNLGAGRWAPGERLRLQTDGRLRPPERSRSLVVADLDGDRRADLLWTDFAGMQIARNAGSGQLELQAPALEAVRIGAHIASRDADGDGDLDLFVEAGLLLNQGGLAFLPSPDPALQWAWPAGPPLLRAADDVDGDGDVDIVLRHADVALRLLRNLGQARFRSEGLSIPAGYLGEALAVADLDGDGRPDIAALGSADGWGDPPLRVFWNAGPKTFPFGTVPTGIKPEYTVAADLDGDGDQDLVTANTGSSVSPLRNEGDGTFTPAGDVVLPSDLGHTEGLVAADLNGDGKVDLAIADQELQLRVLLGRGDLRFDVGPGPSGAEVGAGWESTAAADLDGDGDLDLAIANGSGTNALTLFANDGAARFTHAGTLHTGAGPSTVLAVDLDRDGRPDLISANEDDATVSVLRGTGSFAFAPARHQAVGRRPDALALGDLDGDGFVDLVSANAFHDGQSAENSLTILRNDRAGGFHARQDVPVGQMPRGVAMGDIDGDGDQDVVSANWLSNDATVLLNDGTGGLRPGATVAAGPRPQGVLVADLDGRCGPDLAITNKMASEVRIILATPAGAGDR